MWSKCNPPLAQMYSCRNLRNNIIWSWVTVLFFKWRFVINNKPSFKKIFLIICTILIKTISGNVTKFKKILTWPWTYILLFHDSLYILRKLIGAFITELFRSQIWSLDPPLKCMSLSDQKCMTQPILVNLYPSE